MFVWSYIGISSSNTGCDIYGAVSIICDFYLFSSAPRIRFLEWWRFKSYYYCLIKVLWRIVMCVFLFLCLFSFHLTVKHAFRVKCTIPLQEQTYTFFPNDEHDKKQWLQHFNSAISKATMKESRVWDCVNFDPRTMSLMSQQIHKLLWLEAKSTHCMRL